ncbi:MAG: hypothetical protein RLZZ59_165, partial [Pseudomonadota bacterium]
IRVGNLEDDLDLISSCDWVVEVIVERPEAKAGLYKKIAPYISPKAILSSNTSTLPMNQLKGYVDESIKPRFLLTHFFNPPRQMKLLELIYDEKTDADIVRIISDFISHNLGKTIIRSNDTPGFIANRIGCFLMQLCLKVAYEKKLSVSYIDSVFSKYLGFPSTGIFGLFDLIGLDVMRMISEVLVGALDKKDKFCEIYNKYPFYTNMIQAGYNGRKGLGGFYRLKDVEGLKVKEELDFNTMEYRSIIAHEILLNDDVKSIIDIFFPYVRSLLGVVSSSKEDIDTAMRLGYSWENGPFELESNISGSAQSTKHHSNLRPILENSSAYLYEVTPGNLVISFRTKMNILNEEIFNLIIDSVNYAEKQKAKKLIIYPEGSNFSAGADLKYFLEIAKNQDSDAAEKFLLLGQKAMLSLKYSKVPVIACAKGVALGGGCEILLHSHFILGHLDLSAGLVEVGVGLIPGWGGVKEMVLRSGGDHELLVSNIKNILSKNRSSSIYGFANDYAVENFLCVMKEEDLLPYALARDFEITPCKNLYFECHLDLISSYVDLKLDDHANFIAKELQDALNSSSVSEEKILEIERCCFKKLLFSEVTINKMSAIGQR